MRSPFRFARNYCCGFCCGFATGAVCGAVCGAAQMWVLATWSQHAFVWQAAMLFATIAVAGAVFFIIARLLRIEELDEITDVVRRKLGRRFSRA